MIELVLCKCFWMNVFPHIWWGVLIAIVIIWSLYIVRPLIKNHIESKSSILEKQYSHEKEMKDDAFEREKYWHFVKEAEKPIKYEKELKKCREDLEEFQKKEKELNEGKESLKKEKEQFEKKILEAKIKAYEEIIKTINK